MSFKYVSLFSGAGGLDIGLERAGLVPHSLCEIDEAFCKTLSQNQGWVHTDKKQYLSAATILNADIRTLGARDLVPDGSEIDLIVGGPPCQAFSSSGKQLSVRDPRGALVNEFTRVVAELKPKMFLFENVRGIVTARDYTGEPGGVITKIIENLESLGYSCRAGLLNAADFGSFQRRVRCFIIGSRNGVAPPFPQPTHSKVAGLLFNPWRSLGEFLSANADQDRNNFVFPTPELLCQLQSISNGSGLKSLGKAETTRPGGHWGYRQGTFIADLDLPARTVTGSASQDWVRWGGDLRRLTFEEVKLLQGFPKDWKVNGNKSQQFKQIGNAVPTVFGEILGRTIIEHLNRFPTEKSVKLGLPNEFAAYINYTKRDHQRNSASRTVHLNFAAE